MEDFKIKEEIWIEKYRPVRLSQVAGQEETIERLMSYVATKNLPHLLFSGPPGVGKTASAVSIAREIFGEDLWRENFTELNASDERGIDVVRNKIKNFAKTAPIGGAPFKIIFLDEADALTSDAQSALRRTMEKFSSNCRFILSCNYSSKIIELSSPGVQSTGSGGFPMKPLKKDLNTLQKTRACPLPKAGMKL